MSPETSKIRPSIVDDVIEYEGGQKLVRRTASYPDGRTEMWVQTWEGEPTEGSRVHTGDRDIGICRISGGVLAVPLVLGGEVTMRIPEGVRRLPESAVVTVLYANGLYDTVDVTDTLLELEAYQIRQLRNGLPSDLPFDLPASTSAVDLSGAISAFFGYPPDYDEIGEKVSGRICEADVVQSRAVRIRDERPSSRI